MLLGRREAKRARHTSMAESTSLSKSVDVMHLNTKLSHIMHNTPLHHLKNKLPKSTGQIFALQAHCGHMY